MNLIAEPRLGNSGEVWSLVKKSETHSFRKLPCVIFYFCVVCVCQSSIYMYLDKRNYEISPFNRHKKQVIINKREKKRNVKKERKKRRKTVNDRNEKEVK